MTAADNRDDVWEGGSGGEGGGRIGVKGKEGTL